MIRNHSFAFCLVASLTLANSIVAVSGEPVQRRPKTPLAKATQGETQGVIAILGLDGNADQVVHMAKTQRYLVYFQSRKLSLNIRG